MQKLLDGLHHFRTQLFPNHKEFFERLSKGQSPQALFVTCSDSRVNPNLLTQTDPGDLFILRNAGNIIPPHGVLSGEAATIEYAIAALGVQDVIVCGHSSCGAIGAVLDPGSVKSMPAVAGWLSHADSTARIVRDNYEHLGPAERWTVAVEENVLVQIENLRTLPAVASALVRKALRIHGWVYKIESGEVFAYDAQTGQFERLDTQKGTPMPVGGLPRARGI